MTTKPTNESHKVNESLMQRAKALKLYGLLAHWSEVDYPDWVEPLIHWEETERARRGWNDASRLLASVVSSHWLTSTGNGPIIVTNRLLTNSWGSTS